MSIIIFFIILLVLVLSHEFGHFIVAKKSNIKVDEFSFGFPPKLFGKKFGETTYNFNALPFGGYVKIHGQNPDDLPLNDKDKNRSFSNKPWYIKVGVLLAGVVMNFLVAWLLLSIGFISGLPTSVELAPKGAVVQNQALTIVSVLLDSPAQKFGLKSGDKILSLKTNKDFIKISPFNSPAKAVQAFVENHPTEKIDFSLIRGNKPEEIIVTPSIFKNGGKAMVGISMDMIGELHLPFYQAVWEGLKLSSDLTAKTAAGFYGLIVKSVTGHGSLSGITGPVGIIKIVGDAASFGFIYLLSFTALISINLAILNLIPFPALDGGQLLFILIEKIKGSPINPKVANIINLVGFSLIMIFMVVITYHDIVNLL